MVIKSLLGLADGKNEPMPESEPKRMTGKIYLLHKGYGFISSEEMEYTRIFFHWTALLPNTLNFKQLKKGMKVEFEKKEYPSDKEGDQPKVRAIKIKVIE